MFLARTVAHTVDVFGMLDRMPAGTLELWKQAYRLAPWGDDWLQAATVAAAAHNGGMIAAGMIERVEVARPGDYYPTRVKKRATKPEQSPAELQAILAARYGPKV